MLAAWLAPWRYRLRQEARERELAHALVSTYGEDTLAPFALRADKSYFFSESERAFLAYRVVGGVAIVSGDPIGPDEELAALLARFVEFVHARDWRIAVLGASDRCLPLYRTHGLQALYHGDEAVVETARFSLDGRAIRKVRQSVHRLERAGYSVLVATPAGLSDELRDELEAVARAWRGSAPERGFAMALDALFRLDGDDAVFVIGRGPDGAAEGFLHFAVTPAGRALSLSTMPRLRSVPNGFTEWLVCAAVEWARDNGYEKVSLNFAPFAALLGPEAELSAAQRLQRRALIGLKGHFQLDNLLLFNRKFFPYWQPRFVVYERRLDLPRVGIAALAAESYLPFQKQRKADGMSVSLAGGLVLALVSATAINWGYLLMHQAASALPPLSLRHPIRSIRALFTVPRWLIGFLAGVVGWVFYVVALKLAPLSLVQAASAGGIGVLALLVARTTHAPLVAPRVLGRRDGDDRARAARPVADRAHGFRRARARPWRSGSGSSSPAVAAALVAGPGSKLLASGAGLGAAAGIMYAAGDVGTKAAVFGGWRFLFVPVLLACHGAGFVALQFGFQRGGALATAGVATVLTNALPIVAGTLLFSEGIPSGAAGVARIGAFAAVVVGAALLAQADSEPEPTAVPAV